MTTMSSTSSASPPTDTITSIGRGERLFADAIEIPRLRLVETRPFRSGVVLLRYRPTG
jgi:hypothetical protein